MWVWFQVFLTNTSIGVPCEENLEINWVTAEVPPLVTEDTKVLTPHHPFLHLLLSHRQMLLFLMLHHLKKQRTQRQLRLLNTNKKWWKDYKSHLWNQSSHRLWNKCKHNQWKQPLLLQVPLLNSRSVASMTQMFLSLSPPQRNPTKTTVHDWDYVFTLVHRMQTTQRRSPLKRRKDWRNMQSSGQFFASSLGSYSLLWRSCAFCVGHSVKKSKLWCKTTIQKVPLDPLNKYVPRFSEHLNKGSKDAVPWTAKYKQVMNKFRRSASSGGTSEEKTKLKGKSKKRTTIVKVCMQRIVFPKKLKSQWNHLQVQLRYRPAIMFRKAKSKFPNSGNRPEKLR